MNSFEIISKNKRIEFLRELLHYYVDLSGLGSMSKTDLNALIVFLFQKYADKKYSNFELSRILKIEESKLRGLLRTAYSRFDRREEEEIAESLLKALSEAKYEIHNKNSYEIRFLIQDTIIQKYLEKLVEDEAGTISYTRNSHQLILSISNLLSVYTNLLKRKYSGKDLDNIISDIDKNLKESLLKAAKVDKLPETEKGKSSFEILKNVITTSSSTLNILEKTMLINAVISFLKI